MVKCWDYTKVASFHLDNAESIVKYSLVVHKSVTYLDLSLCELSSLKGKRSNVIYPNRTLSPSIVVDRNFVCTVEGCKKSLAPNRKYLYYLHLDVAWELELLFGNNRTNKNLRYHSDGILLKKIGIVTLWFKTRLNGMATDFFHGTNQKVRALHQISRLGQHIDFIAQYGYIRMRGSDILYSKCSDSIVVKDFLIAMGFEDGHLLRLPPQVVEYLLHHASCAGYTLRDGPPREDLINAAICKKKFEHVETLFRYRDAPRFCESSYAEIKRKIGNER